MPDFTLLSGINTNLYNIYDYQNFNKMILEFCYGEVCVKIKKNIAQRRPLVTKAAFRKLFLKIL